MRVPDSVLSVKEYECTVVSNKLVSSFIKEFIVALPPGEHMDFIPGSYAQIRIPEYEMDYDKDIDKESLGEYLPTWEKFGLFSLKCRNDEATRLLCAPTQWPTIPPRVTASCSLCASLPRRSSPNPPPASWT